MKTVRERIIISTFITSFFLAFLGCILIRAAFNNFDNYVSYTLLLLGISLILFFGIMLLIVIRHSRKKSVQQELEKLHITQYGSKFIIDLDSVKIKSNNWSSSRFIENNLYDIEILEKHIQTILEIAIELDGQNKLFYWASELDPKSLEMYFAIQKQTDFYLDLENQDHFYLDLGFIR